ncbi:MAG TPA: glycosyl hydrolase 53 family protein [Steroidobacteraceae bacterium]|nr:glycosyl hydrolase 53 family protein [Steroidobacteraceae bacterium]
MKSKFRLLAFAAFSLFAVAAGAQQPAKPVDISPNDGEIYYLVNQHSGLQADSSRTGEGRVNQQPRNFSSTSQRWALARSGDGRWQIENAAAELCLVDEEHIAVLHECEGGLAARWELLPTANGYYAIRNGATHRLVAVAGETTGVAAPVITTAAVGQPTQSQLWLLRPAFFRGVDNALLEKQEALRVSQNTPWWKDNGQPRDVLGLLKDHGLNMVRLRPSSSPPYLDPSAPGCQGNACYAETEAQDLDMAKRARNLGLSIELTLLFDGGSSRSVPPAWASDTPQQAQADLYAYVKAEIERYRRAGVMPDLVAIGNEVDTGFLGALGSPTGAQFGNFAALQIIGMQAVADAAGDPALGSPLPAPLTCIHITPAWDLTSFFTLVNQNGIPYDVICQSYYPFYHGPLTGAQAAVANPYNKPVEQDALVNAANQLGRPIFLIETGEHYENGFDANDPWYPPSVANQRQFLLDLQSVAKSLPHQLGMGIAYWDAAGVNILAYGGPWYFNGGYPPDSIYVWNGLTLFDNGDSSGSSNQTDPRYSEVLAGLDAVGNKLDPTLNYKLATPQGGILARAQASSEGTTEPASPLRLAHDSANPTPEEQWTIRSNNDGYFQIRSAAGNPQSWVLDGSDAGDTVAAPPNGAPAQEWNVRSLGRGLFQFVNRASGQAASLRGHELDFQITPTL